MRVMAAGTLPESGKCLSPSLFVIVPKLILRFTNKFRNRINSALLNFPFLNGLNYDT